MKKIFGLLAVVAVASPALALPLGSNNNFIGVAAGLQENLLRTPAGGEYLSPYEVVNGQIASPQMPGSFESVRVVGGTVTGVNIAQPANISDPADSRVGVINPVLGGATWGARAGAVAELTRNDSIGVNLVDNSTTVVAYNFTPGGTFGADDGLAPGSLPGDGIPDFVPLIGTTVVFNSSYLGENDLTALGLSAADVATMTPIIDVYEDLGVGSTPFDLSTPAAQSALLEADFNHNTGAPVGATLADAVDGDLMLRAKVKQAALVTFQFIFNDTNGNGIIDAGDEVLQDVLLTGGTLEFIGGKLVTDGVVTAGSTGSFSWSLTQEFVLIERVPVGLYPGGGNDPDLDQWDFLDLRPGGSNSANLALVIDPEVPEPVTAGLSLLALGALGGYATRRRRA